MAGISGVLAARSFPCRRLTEEGQEPYFEDYQHIALIDFSSKRKKMTVQPAHSSILP